MSDVERDIQGEPAPEDVQERAPENSAFWNWSISVYDREDVAPACLDLQDTFGLDVNLTLWCVWLGCVAGKRPETDVLEKARTLHMRWSQVTGALRKARRELKTPPDEIEREACEAVRAIIKAQELETERLFQNALFELSVDAPDSLADAVPLSRETFLRLHPGRSRLVRPFLRLVEATTGKTLNDTLPNPGANV